MKQSILMLGTDNFIVVVYVGESSRAESFVHRSKWNFIDFNLWNTMEIYLFAYYSVHNDLACLFSIL